MALQIIALWGLAAIVAAVAGGIIAYVKRRDHSAWSAWCFIFPPLLIWLLFLRKRPGARPRQPSNDDDDHEHELA